MLTLQRSYLNLSLPKLNYQLQFISTTMDSSSCAPAKRRPPRLASTDRTVSLAIDNYAPPPPTISAMVNAHSMHKTDQQMISPVLLQPMSADAAHNRAKLFYMGRSTNSISHDDYHTHYGQRKPAIRRSDTLGVHNFAGGGSGGMYEMEATGVSSFRNDKSPAMMAKRTASMRHSSVHPNDVKGADGKTAAERRSCKMHRSFNDQLRKPQIELNRKEIIIETIKCHSLGDEADTVTEAKRKLSPKFNSANVSLEKDIYRSRSNSRNQLAPEDDLDAIESISRKHSSQSLEDKQFNFQRGSKYTHSFYLNPNSAVSGEDFPIVTYSPRPVQDRRQHSASMRSRPYRETLASTKKSKSFVGETHRVFERSPVAGNRRDSKAFATVEDAKRSPRLSTGNNLLTPDGIVAIGESRKSSNMDISELDYDEIIRLYQENRRKSSLAPIAGVCSDKKLKKKSIDLNSDTDVNEDFMRKRKKIVCIIVTVFLGLVFASVFVVVFTLTHSIDAQVHNQTKKVYTFSRDREMPIHYNSGNLNLKYINYYY